jgi:hypothetical protein
LSCIFSCRVGGFRYGGLPDTAPQSTSVSGVVVRRIV